MFNNKKQHKRNTLKRKKFDKELPTLVYNYCQWCQRYKSQLTNSKNYIAGIRQNKQVPCLHCGPIENLKQ